MEIYNIECGVCKSTNFKYINNNYVCQGCGYILTASDKRNLLKMDIESNKIESIHEIKAHSKPPWDDNDIYYLRYPWKLFGGVSSRIGMKWCWYRDDIINRNTTYEDVLLAHNEITKGEHNK